MRCLLWFQFVSLFRAKAPATSEVLTLESELPIHVLEMT